MSYEEKINYMRIATGICGYSFATAELDLLVSLYDLVLEKQGKTDLDSITTIQFDVKSRAQEPMVKEQEEQE